MAVLPKGNLYNKDVISTIYKLIEKNQIEVAYKLFKCMKKPTRNNEETLDYGRFFIKKLITTDVVSIKKLNSIFLFIQNTYY